VTIADESGRDSPEWWPWQRQLRATHLDLSCDACAYPGPLLESFGTTEVPEQTARRVVRPSRIADGQRLRSVPYTVPAHRVRTHYAVRCPVCGDQAIYHMGTWEELSADDVDSPRPPKPEPCCEHECDTGPHSVA
jgi:hypothetical protein